VRVGLVAVPIVDGPVVDGSSVDLRPVGADAVRPCPPYAVYLLAGVLASEGHEGVLADLIAPGTGNLVPPDLGDVGLVGISATSLSWAAARRTMRHLRDQRRELPIVVGGVHASQFDTWVLEHSEADFVVRGDGELPLLALCAALDRNPDPAAPELHAVPSLTWRDRRGRTVRNPDGPKVSAGDLTRWTPDYEQLPHRAYWGLALETARGCTFDCTFCSTPHRKRWRGGEATAVVDRLQALEPLLDRTISRHVYLVDDEFTLNPTRAIAIGHELTRRAVDLGILYDARAPDLLRPGVLDALAPHTRSLLVGAECGYDEGLRRIGKGTTCDGLQRTAAALADAGIARVADFSFILGLPWEDRDDVRRTVDFGLDLADRFGVHLLFNWYAQIPGSHLWAEARARGAIHESRYDELGVQRDPAVFLAAVSLTVDDVQAIAAEVRAGIAGLATTAPRPEFGLPVALSNPVGVLEPS
jgi:radical SAM superfamily enzyme YgiQ (UPF0313 family)